MTSPYAYVDRNVLIQAEQTRKFERMMQLECDAHNEVEALRIQVSYLKQQVEALQAEVNGLKGMVRDAQAEVNGLKGQVQHADTEQAIAVYEAWYKARELVLSTLRNS